MIVAITGHRPEDLPNPEWVHKTLKAILHDNHIELLIQGMAAGADLMAAALCIELNIPFVCAKPWAGHTSRIQDRKLYSLALEKAKTVVNVNNAEQYAGAHVYHQRNEYMVDNADTVIAIWTGKKTGGTAACVRYAKKTGKRIIHINPQTQQVTLSENESLF